jgi:cytochrome P450
MGPLISIATHTAKSTSERETVTVLDEVVEYKRRVPGDDLLTSLISASSDGDRLSHDELIATCRQLNADIRAEAPN